MDKTTLLNCFKCGCRTFNCAINKTNKNCFVFHYSVGQVFSPIISVTNRLLSHWLIFVTHHAFHIPLATMCYDKSSLMYTVNPQISKHLSFALEFEYNNENTVIMTYTMYITTSRQYSFIIIIKIFKVIHFSVLIIL